MSKVPLYEYAPVGVRRANCITTNTAAMFRGTSLKGHSAPLGTYGRTMPRVIWLPSGGGRFLISEVLLYRGYSKLKTRTTLGPYGRASPRRMGPSWGLCVSLNSNNPCSTLVSHRSVDYKGFVLPRFWGVQGYLAHKKPLHPRTLQ